MRLVVTGGAGFIGHHLVRTAIARGHKVAVVDDLSRGSFERPGLSGAALIDLDIRETDLCASSFAGADCVIHLAAQSNVMGSQSNPNLTFSTNVSGTWSVAQACRMAGIGHLVFTSSREVYGEALTLPVTEDHPIAPRNLYGASKAAGEMLLRTLPAGGPAVSILRLANVIGPGDSGRVLPLWLDAAERGSELTIFGGQQLLDFVPVDLVVEALLRVAEGEPLADPVNIGSGRGSTLQELANFVIETTASRSNVILLPARGPEVMRFQADVSRMQSVLGIEPPVRPLDSIRAWSRAS